MKAMSFLFPTLAYTQFEIVAVNARGGLEWVWIFAFLGLGALIFLRCSGRRLGWTYWLAASLPGLSGITLGIWEIEHVIDELENDGWASLIGPETLIACGFLIIQLGLKLSAALYAILLCFYLAQSFRLKFAHP